MQRFYYNDKQQFSQLLSAFNGVSEKFSKKDYDTDKALKQLLDNAIKVYKDAGFTDKESQLQVLRAELTSIEKNIHPLTYEKVTIRKGEMKMSICLKILQSIEQLLRHDYTYCTDKLQEVRNMISQILLAGLQGGLITDTLLDSTNTESELQKLWKLLATDANIALAQRRVLMSVSIYDVLLLMEELIGGMLKVGLKKPKPSVLQLG
ncbi:hypothetical protein GFS24_27730 [Chitinophaga sp. SYP-B3965]|uniref:hypothetical protein n=1 Tax=Chitinophaga sp. SYP-B3965 TaxID=2663120 RepID=UPI001299D78D|nr:hypothetical protein [Chitinophaga sp. SYP-B3965]MRG48933.1 hypothetical protein [Chitinophaga sp. SYP-B3965]